MSAEALDHADETFPEALARLKEEVRDRQPKAATSLPMGRIKTVVALFQPRDVDRAFLESEGHVKTLAEAIENAPGYVLDPIVVWWSGKHWYVIDGHHRLEAYKVAATKVELPAIPVKPFEGTLFAAIRESSALNCRDKLRMTKTDKLERAWQLVCLPEGWTKVSIHNATGTSIRSIGYMRSKKAQLLENDPQADLLGMTWNDVKCGKRTEVDDGWEDRQAMDIYKKLVKTFDNRLADQPLITAKALELYSERLVEDLSEWWRPRSARELEEADF